MQKPSHLIAYNGGSRSASRLYAYADRSRIGSVTALRRMLAAYGIPLSERDLHYVLVLSSR
ncbi:MULTISPECIES: hypothetical protein [Paenibacillus]|uniref:hypothetical protein n=1 Tax=Paenibacillus TaxID=44249 RepID=UPI00126860E5|nr:MULTISPECIES: hypothetical protein [Paenibacillus]